MADGLAERILRLERQVADAKATVQRLIVRGVASQLAEDKLRRLEIELADLKSRAA
jgi:hypothetical protein